MCFFFYFCSRVAFRSFRNEFIVTYFRIVSPCLLFLATWTSLDRVLKLSKVRRYFQFFVLLFNASTAGSTFAKLPTMSKHSLSARRRVQPSRIYNGGYIYFALSRFTNSVSIASYLALSLQTIRFSDLCAISVANVSRLSVATELKKKKNKKS